MQTASLLIVDDSPTELHSLLGLLKKHYKITVSTSGEEALQRLKKTGETLPNLILLDVNMPGISGIDTCAKIKKDISLQDIDVIFYSGNDSIQEITQGFEVGASDYVTKPYEPDILLSKIQAALNNQSRRKELAGRAATANNIAMTAMRDSGDLGLILEFLRACFHIKNMANLCEIISNTLQQFGLNSCTFIYHDYDNAIHSSEGTPSELEIMLLNRLKHNTSTLHEHENRLIISRQGVAILIKNMPSNHDHAARIRDHLMTLIESIQNKISQLNELSELREKKNILLKKFLVEVNSRLQSIQQQQEAHKKENMNILDGMVQDVETSFFSMGLTDIQEDKLLSIMTQAAHNALEHLEKGMQLDAELKSIIAEMSRMVVKTME